MLGGGGVGYKCVPCQAITGIYRLVPTQMIRVRDPDASIRCSSFLTPILEQYDLLVLPRGSELKARRDAFPTHPAQEVLLPFSASSFGTWLIMIRFEEYLALPSSASTLSFPLLSSSLLSYAFRFFIRYCARARLGFAWAGNGFLVSWLVSIDGPHPTDENICAGIAAQLLRSTTIEPWSVSSAVAPLLGPCGEF